ncbi:Holliday junction branch migration protein RuvA [Blautia sp. An249]|uniref:Holliday junction branch migration protein RuvA n=1 Tax=Blautia sp. An249 TaxID=1965603 RepID=UPI000B3AAC31|nr:Holliday junction branch migration protein RuvA [Blautia sp. An249]OUO80284.1 Holliday junction branch migration protein RuvA [Blautia sp. An249]
MLAYITGEITEITEHGIILDNQGMGYEIAMPVSHLDRGGRPGKKVKVHTYFHVREDAVQLYGFWQKDELEVFKLLLGVNGIGPKAALGILSGLSADELRFAVLSDDVKTISKAPGVGKKTAQKLILELKDKLNLRDAFEQKLANEEKEPERMQISNAKQEAVEALRALGYGGADALRAVQKVDHADTMDVETLLKAALKNM